MYIKFKTLRKYTDVELEYLSSIETCKHRKRLYRMEFHRRETEKNQLKLFPSSTES